MVHLLPYNGLNVHNAAAALFSMGTTILLVSLVCKLLLMSASMSANDHDLVL